MSSHGPTPAPAPTSSPKPAAPSISAALHGHPGAGGTSVRHDLAVAGGEVIEEMGKEILPIIMEEQTKGKTGVVLAAAVAQRIDYGKLIAKFGAHFTARQVAEAIAHVGGFKDQASKWATILVVENLIASAAMVGIDKLSATLANPTEFARHLKGAIIKVVPTTSAPDGGLLALTYHTGNKGSAFTHLARVDAAGALVPFADKGFANTRCRCLADDYQFHALAHPSVTRGGSKRKDGSTIPPERVSGAEFLVDPATDIITALQSKPALCPDCFPRFTANIVTKAPAHVPSTAEKIRKSPVAKGCLAAIRRHAANNGSRSHIAVDHLEDIYKLDFDAFLEVCESVAGRVVPIVDASGGVVGYHMDDDVAKEFVLGLDTIGTELKFSNKMEEAAHGAWEQFKHAWEHGEGFAKVLAFGVLVPTILYFLAAFAIVYAYFVVGWFGNQPVVLLGSSIAAFLWVIPWHGAESLNRLMAGVLASVGSFAQTARAIATLMPGFAMVMVLVRILEWLVLGQSGSMQVSVAMLAAFVGILAYDRQVARWTESEAIRHFSEKVAENQAWALSLSLVVLSLMGLGAAYVEQVRATTMFRLVVETADVNGTPVHYIPLPNGNVYRPEEILGRTVAEQVVKAAAGTAVPNDYVCLTPGTSVDVPKHAEKVVSDGCPPGAVGYALREQPFGMGWGVQSHASLAELVAADKADDAALKAAVQAPAASLTSTAAPVSPAVTMPEANPVEADQANADAAPSKPRVNRADLPEMFQ